MSIEARFEAIRQLTPVAPAERKQLKIEHLAIGGFLKIKEDVFQVKSLGYYLDVKWKNFANRKSDYWITELELFNLHTAETVYLEWEIDDELEISLTTALIKMREITFEGSPLTNSALEEIADEEHGKVFYQGNAYHYVEDETWAGRYAKTKVKNGIPMRAYEFESDNHAYLTIETWHEDDDDRPSREAFLSKELNAKDIEILQLKCY